MLANIAESDVSALHVGQEVKVSLLAFPGQVFNGRIWSIDAMVDPNTHRMLVRSAIDDPDHALRSGMFATYVIRTGDPVRSLAVPLDGVVREGDGTNTVWVTADRRKFSQRIVKMGMQSDGYRQILDSLQPGELVATDGAVFLSNDLDTKPVIDNAPVNKLGPSGAQNKDHGSVTTALTLVKINGQGIGGTGLNRGRTGTAALDGPAQIKININTGVLSGNMFHPKHP